MVVVTAFKKKPPMKGIYDRDICLTCSLAAWDGLREWSRQQIQLGRDTSTGHINSHRRQSSTVSLNRNEIWDIYLIIRMQEELRGKDT